MMSPPRLRLEYMPKSNPKTCIQRMCLRLQLSNAYAFVVLSSATGHEKQKLVSTHPDTLSSMGVSPEMLKSLRTNAVNMPVKAEDCMITGESFNTSSSLDSLTHYPLSGLALVFLGACREPRNTSLKSNAGNVQCNKPLRQCMSQGLLSINRDTGNLR
eukprot:3004587-Amphidinium_carterae.1